MTGIRARILPVAVGAMLLTTGLFGARPTVAQEQVAHPSHIHSGTCDAIGEVVAPLGDVAAVGMMDGTPMADGGVLGSANAIPVEVGSMAVEIGLADILAADHAIVVHASEDDMGTYIACGNLGGLLFAESTLVVGIAQLNDSGYTGIASLTDNEDGTTNVTVVLAAQDGMMTGMPGMADAAVAHPAHIHNGTCDAIGEVVAPLGDVSRDLTLNGTPLAGTAAGSAGFIATQTSFSTVDLLREDILAAEHVIVVHASADDMGTYIACGSIGGTPDDVNEINFGLAPLNDSGFTGIGAVIDSGDGTTVVGILLVQG